jgi:hypothetical protein
VTEVAAVATGCEIRTVKLGCSLDDAPECSWRMTWT